ncbi:hypothetical protein M0811_03624 [Anaeramoeba ignava]|uniref:Uncharacterized protein n=1 Tax=Anaeramoeba ignava TaxID=1746090 RepID=A0A9Q0L570_ANAIG|nr:hypothetical protein M0811_03624 [Anaeramoeba ignava]
MIPFYKNFQINSLLKSTSFIFQFSSNNENSNFSLQSILEKLKEKNSLKISKGEEHENFRKIMGKPEKSFGIITSGDLNTWKIKNESNEILVEEFSSKKSEYWIRKVKSEKDLEKFIDFRSEGYEKMWGSCCSRSIKYEEEFDPSKK